MLGMGGGDGSINVQSTWNQANEKENNSSLPRSNSTWTGLTNPFATPAIQPQLPSTNPFQPNGLVSGKPLALSLACPHVDSY